MPVGTIYKSLSGFYYINKDNVSIQCNAKGIFRHNGETPLVGDNVEYSLINDNSGIIESVLPRKNSFIRPAVANVDTIVFFASGAKPITDPFLIDRVSVIAESASCEFVLCINKIDLDKAEELNAIYLNSNINVVNTSIYDRSSVNNLLNYINGKTAVFTGNSGVGKSSIINQLIPNLKIETNEISEKLGRGKHTTRHIELYQCGESTYIADTPGFASFDIRMISDIDANELQYNFIDFKDFLGGCRFNDCKHLNEPGCSIISAVHNGKINKSRYDSYCKLFALIDCDKSWD